MEILQTIFSAMFGLAFAGGLLAFLYKRNAVDWEQIVPYYGRPWRQPLARKRFLDMKLYSDGRPLKSYRGVVTIGLYEDGVGFKINPVLMPFHDPIFVPFEEVRAWKQRWYINARSKEVAFDRIPSMRFIMPASQVVWMADAAFGRIDISEELPPHGNWPLFTFSYAVISGIAGSGLAVYFLWRFFLA